MYLIHIYTHITYIYICIFMYGPEASEGPAVPERPCNARVRLAPSSQPLSHLGAATIMVGPPGNALPGTPVARNLGLLCPNDELLYGIIAWKSSGLELWATFNVLSAMFGELCAFCKGLQATFNELWATFHELWVISNEFMGLFHSKTFWILGLRSK